jgi:hypothetical protein
MEGSMVKFICENCGNEADNKIKLGCINGQPFCEACIDDFIIDSHIDFGVMLIKKSSLDKIDIPQNFLDKS